MGGAIKTSVVYDIVKPWYHAPEVWRTLAGKAVWIFVIGVAVGAYGMSKVNDDTTRAKPGPAHTVTVTPTANPTVTRYIHDGG